MSGFKAAGIAPFNRDIFTEDDFLSSYVSDRPMAALDPDKETAQEAASSAGENISQEEPLIPDGEGSSKKDTGYSVMVTPRTETISSYPTPEDVRPFPKSASRRTARRSRMGKSAILTHTPTKARLEEEMRKRSSK